MRLNKPIFAVICSAALTLGASTALAANASIENALKENPDLSTFYDAAKKTGVLDELKETRSYTVFAPTNKAFAEMTEAQYPCLYSEQCTDEIADIMRNHFVPGQVTFSGPIKTTVFSIDKMNVNLGVQNGHVRTVAGNNIVNRGQIFGGVLVEIDGVIASPQELANIKTLKYVKVPAPVTENVVEKTVTDKVFYAPDGTPDGVSRTTRFEVVPTTVLPAEQLQ